MKCEICHKNRAVVDLRKTLWLCQNCYDKEKKELAEDKQTAIASGL